MRLDTKKFKYHNYNLSGYSYKHTLNAFCQKLFDRLGFYFNVAFYFFCQGFLPTVSCLMLCYVPDTGIFALDFAFFSMIYMGLPAAEVLFGLLSVFNLFDSLVLDFFVMFRVMLSKAHIIFFKRMNGYSGINSRNQVDNALVMKFVKTLSYILLSNLFLLTVALLLVSVPYLSTFNPVFLFSSLFLLGCFVLGVGKDVNRIFIMACNNLSTTPAVTLKSKFEKQATMLEWGESLLKVDRPHILLRKYFVNTYNNIKASYVWWRKKTSIASIRKYYNDFKQNTAVKYIVERIKRPGLIIEDFEKYFSVQVRNMEGQVRREASLKKVKENADNCNSILKRLVEKINNDVWCKKIYDPEMQKTYTLVRNMWKCDSDNYKFANEEGWFCAASGDLKPYNQPKQKDNKIMGMVVKARWYSSTNTNEMGGEFDIMTFIWMLKSQYKFSENMFDLRVCYNVAKTKKIHECMCKFHDRRIYLQKQMNDLLDRFSTSFAIFDKLCAEIESLEGVDEKFKGVGLSYMIIENKFMYIPIKVMLGEKGFNICLKTLKSWIELDEWKGDYANCVLIVPNAELAFKSDMMDVETYPKLKFELNDGLYREWLLQLRGKNVLSEKDFNILQQRIVGKKGVANKVEVVKPGFFERSALEKLGSSRTYDKNGDVERIDDEYVNVVRKYEDMLTRVQPL